SSCRRCTTSSSSASAMPRWLSVSRRPMRDTWVIAKREFLERVKSKWFVVMTVLWPLFMVGSMVVPVLLAGQGTKGAKVQVVDKSGKIGDTMVYKLRAPQI